MSADPEVTLKLPLSSVNYALQVLAQRPYAEVNGLISNVQSQAQACLTPPLPKIEPASSGGAPAEATTH